jgi:hypothetical protein
MHNQAIGFEGEDIMKTLSIAIVAVGLLASGASAANSAPRGGWPGKAEQFQGLYQNSGSGWSADGRDHADFGLSGTRGRDDLGANPHYPEGPGNATD